MKIEHYNLSIPLIIKELRQKEGKCAYSYISGIEREKIKSSLELILLIAKKLRFFLTF